MNARNGQRTSGIITLVSTVVSVGVLTGYSGQARALPPAQTAATAAIVYNSAQAKRGQTKYSEACSACHLLDLSGSDQAPALAGASFLGNWDGLTVSDLADRIRISMPQDNAGSLSTQQAVDIVAYILQANEFPAGEAELQTDKAVLKAMTIKRK